MSAATAIVRREDHYDGLTMVVEPTEAMQRLQKLREFISQVMVEGEDYGNIPDLDKKNLSKSGAEKLAEVYGFAAEIVPTESVKDWERGFFYFEYKVRLTSRKDGTFVGEGIGSCNSRESKYAGRWVQESEVPSYLDKSTLKSRTASEWLWASKLPAGVDKEGLPVQWRKSKKKGSDYPVYQYTVTTYQVPNEDICSLVNNIQKMGKKRAYVDAVISATRSSGILTQDMEDSAQQEHVEPDAPARESSERPKPPTAAEIKENPATVARYAQRMGEIAKADSMPSLKRVWTNISADLRSTAISFEQHSRLLDAKDRRKKELESPPPGDAYEDPSMDVGEDPAGLGGP